MTRNKKLPKPRRDAPFTPGWDMGACGEANRQGLQQEEAGEIDATTGKMVNPNNVRRVRRVDMLEHWQRHGTISQAGYTAACKLRDAFENTQRGPGTSFEQDRVDSSPKPDHAVTIQIDRISAFEKVYRHVTMADRPLINHCVLNGVQDGVAASATPASLRIKGKRPYFGANYPSGLVALSAALDRLAKAMGGSK